MAGKLGNIEVRYILWSYLIGLATGLIIFGAGNFYYERIFR